MAKEKMSQTQTSTKYAEPPIKINRALYGRFTCLTGIRLLGINGCMCSIHLWKHQNRASGVVLSQAVIVRNCSGHFEFVLIAPAFVGCFFVSEGIARYCTQRHWASLCASDVLYCYLLFKCGNRSDFHSNDAAACRNLPLFKRKETLYRKRGP